MKTTLYRYFDSKGQLLYVGITKNQFDRLNQHSRNSTWMPFIASATFHHFETREEALRAETKAIATELPKFNKAGPVIEPDDLNHFIDLITNKLADDWHSQLAVKVANTMLELNQFSEANEITKLGFSLSASFDWTDDGETRVVLCDKCKKLTDSKWFDFVENDSQSIIDEYKVA